MEKELTDFLSWNNAGSNLMTHLEMIGAETLEDAWNRASPAYLIWIVTRPGIMSPEQRRLFLVMVLESIEDKLTDPRSKNILEKLRTKEPITAADKKAARAATVDAENTRDRAAARAAARAARAATATWANTETWDVAAEARDIEVIVAMQTTGASTWVAATEVREKQARWIRENFKLADLHINLTKEKKYEED